MDVLGPAGSLQERNDWASGKRQTVTVQEQEFASAAKKWERWGECVNEVWNCVCVCVWSVVAIMAILI